MYIGITNMPGNAAHVVSPPKPLNTASDILFAYMNNTAWYTLTIIAPGILAAMLY